MKSWLESLLIALSMYSAIPVKCLNWTEKNLRNAMVFFPLVGLLCGVGLWLVWLVCGLLHVSSVLFGVLAVVSGVLITGGIHLDGFCDTADALYSRRPQEEKLRILKDPNCGPFAVFSVILVLLVSFGSYVQLYQTQGRNVVWLLAGGFLLTRCLSGIAVTTLPVAPTSSLVKTFGEMPANMFVCCCLSSTALPVCCWCGSGAGWQWCWSGWDCSSFGAVLTWRRSSSAVSPAIWQAFSWC